MRGPWEQRGRAAAEAARLLDMAREGELQLPARRVPHLQGQRRSTRGVRGRPIPYSASGKPERQPRSGWPVRQATAIATACTRRRCAGVSVRLQSAAQREWGAAGRGAAGRGRRQCAP